MCAAAARLPAPACPRWPLLVNQITLPLCPGAPSLGPAGGGGAAAPVPPNPAGSAAALAHALAAAGGWGAGAPGHAGGHDEEFEEGSYYSGDGDESWEEELGADAGAGADASQAPVAAPPAAAQALPDWAAALGSRWKANAGGGAAVSAPPPGLAEALKAMGEALGMPLASGLELEAGGALPAGALLLPLDAG